MSSKKRCTLHTVFYLASGIVVTSFLLRLVTDVGKDKEASSPRNDIVRVGGSGLSKGFMNCTTEERHIVFIKVHKAGSSTVANILFRFGITRNLTFLLPYIGVTVASQLKARWTNIMPLPKGAKHYDMLSNHAVYERDEIDRLFPRDRAVIAILRHPMGQLESGIYYYYRDAIEGKDKVGEYLRNPKTLKLDDRYINNSMALELGVPRDRFYNTSFVRSHVLKIAGDMKLVLIMERLLESLVLMKRRLCWSLKDIIYITRNINEKKPSFHRTDADFWNHRNMMEANYIVYEFFYKRLEKEIAESPRLNEEVKRFKHILQDVSKFCSEDNSVHRTSISIPESEWNEGSLLLKKDCAFFHLNGLQVLAYAKQYQYGKV